MGIAFNGQDFLMWWLKILEVVRFKLLPFRLSWIFIENMGHFFGLLVFIVANQSSPDAQRILYFRCVGRECQVAAYDLLVELGDGCPENLFNIVSQLICMHHVEDPGTLKEWEVHYRIYCCHKIIMPFIKYARNSVRSHWLIGVFR